MFGSMRGKMLEAMRGAMRGTMLGKMRGAMRGSARGEMAVLEWDWVEGIGKRCRYVAARFISLTVAPGSIIVMYSPVTLTKHKINNH